MSEVVSELRNSDDKLKIDLAAVLEHWQETKRAQGHAASLGREPGDIRRLGAVEVISRRVLSASVGFEEVDPNLSYEGIVVKHPDRFSADVIEAARKRMKPNNYKTQDIQFFIKTSLFEMFDEAGMTADVTDWIGRTARIPASLREYHSADTYLASGFRSFIWLHEQAGKGEHGRGLTALVQFGPMAPDRQAQIIDAEAFARPVGRDILEAHKSDDTFFAKINKYRHTRTWPVSDSDVEDLLSAVRRKINQIAKHENHAPDPRDQLNLEKIDEIRSLKQVISRRNQSAFRRALLEERPDRCAITGTNVVAVLEAAHIIPYAERFADRDRIENGLLLRSDIHKLFDLHQISIDPESRCVRVSDTLNSDEYRALDGKKIEENISNVSLNFHFALFAQEQS